MATNYLPLLEKVYGVSFCEELYGNGHINDTYVCGQPPYLMQRINTTIFKNVDHLMENIENTAVIVECGFISNPEECTKLSEKEYRKQLSLAIVCGIIEYIENNSK
jgi:hypothetical protein